MKVWRRTLYALKELAWTGNQYNSSPPGQMKHHCMLLLRLFVRFKPSRTPVHASERNLLKEKGLATLEAELRPILP